MNEALLRLIRSAAAYFRKPFPGKRSRLISPFLVAPVIVLVLAMEARCNTYYIDYTAGNDTNNGLSTSSAWQHCPGMVISPKSYKHTPGDVFIFCGGTTWPNSVFPLKMSYQGGVVTNDTYESSNGWFHGASWTMPSFDAQDAAMVGSPHSVIFISGTNITVSGLEVKNLLIANTTNWNGYGACSIEGAATASNVLIENCYLHDWLPGIAATNAAYSDTDFGGIIFLAGAQNVVVSNNTIGPGLAPAGLTGNSGCGVAGFPSIITSNLIFGCTDIINAAATNISFNTLCFSTNSYDPKDHANCIFGTMSTGGTTWIYGNKIHDVDTEFQTMLLHPAWTGATNTTYYIYDNLIYNVTSPIDIDESGIVTSNNGNIAHCYNNTIIHPTCVAAVLRNQAYHLTEIDCENNLWISDTPTGNPIGTAATSSAYAPVYTLIDQSNIWLTSATASADGYNLSNPSASPWLNCPTIGEGLNLNSLGFVSVDINGNPRPLLGNWAVGAYQVSSPILPPSNLHVVSQ
jgi:hypothetical protein